MQGGLGAKGFCGIPPHAEKAKSTQNNWGGIDRNRQLTTLMKSSRFERHWQKEEQGTCP
jgi:hypothetical protein